MTQFYSSNPSAINLGFRRMEVVEEGTGDVGCDNNIGDPRYTSSLEEI